MIYFIRASRELANRIKIGYTKSDVKGRLSQLQTGNPTDLEIVQVIPGSRSIEKALHKKFRGDWIRGEWFRYSTAIKNFIKDPDPSKIENKYVWERKRR